MHHAIDPRQAEQAPSHNENARRHNEFHPGHNIHALPHNIGDAFRYAEALEHYANARIRYAEARVRYAVAPLRYAEARVRYAGSRFRYASVKIRYANAVLRWHGRLAREHCWREFTGGLPVPLDRAIKRIPLDQRAVGFSDRSPQIEPAQFLTPCFVITRLYYQAMPGIPLEYAPPARPNEEIGHMIVHVLLGVSLPLLTMIAGALYEVPSPISEYYELRDFLIAWIIAAVATVSWLISTGRWNVRRRRGWISMLVLLWAVPMLIWQIQLLRHALSAPTVQWLLSQ